MAKHEWRMGAAFRLSDEDVAELRDHTRALLAGHMTGINPMDAEAGVAGFAKVMRPGSMIQANVYCEVCRQEWVPAEGVVAGPEAGEDCPGPPTP